MEDVTIHEEPSSRLNEDSDIASHFVHLHTRLNSIDVWMMSDGE